MKVKFIQTIIVILVLSLGVVGCGNSIVNKSIEQAKSSIESKEYDKSLLSLEMALDEESDNEEVKKLYDIVDKYQQAKKLIEDNNIDEAKKVLDAINIEYTSYAIKEDIDNLKSEVENQYKEIEKVNVHLKEAENLFNNKKYGEAKVCLGANILGIVGDSIEPNKYATEEQKQKALEITERCELGIVDEEKNLVESKNAQYIEKLNSIEMELNDLYKGETTIEMKEFAGKTYKKWDNALNEIYSLLKVQLSNSDMDALTEKQIQWIEYRDITAKNESLAFEGGTMEGLQYTSTLANITKERCYELVNNYMK